MFILNFKLPKAVKSILTALHLKGYKAYVVGGCVRDILMGREPNDWDICTSALPKEVMACFEGHRIIETGLRHGTISLNIDENFYEVTTFRKDGDYSDHRHPNFVEYVSDIKEDLSRRDFTINALAYNQEEGLLDFFNGHKDIANKQIRCVGDSNKRFDQDALRIFRALRFSSELGFQIEADTDIAIREKKELLNAIAIERLAVELNRILLGSNVRKVLENYGEILAVVIPEITPLIGFNQNSKYHYLDVWGHTAKTVSSIQPILELRLTMLLHDIAKPECYTEVANVGHFYGHPKRSAEIAKKVLSRLKYDKKTAETVTKFVLYHDVVIENDEISVKRMLSILGLDKMRDLCKIKKADAMAKAKERCFSQIQEIEAIEQTIENIVVNKKCYTLRELAINGNDLVETEISEGEKIGETLNKLLEMVIENKLENNKEKLLDFLMATLDK